GERLPATLYEPQRAVEAGRVGNDPAVGAGGTLAVCAHQRHPGRRSEPRVVGNDESGAEAPIKGASQERGFGTPGVEGHGCGRKRRLAEEATESQLRAAAGGALGAGHGHDRQAALRTSGRRKAWLQPEQARTSVAPV